MKTCFQLFCIPISFENAGSLRNLVHGSSSGRQWAVARVRGQESALVPLEENRGSPQRAQPGLSSQGPADPSLGVPFAQHFAAPHTQLIGEGHDNPLQYSCLEHPMNRGAWWATVHGITRVRHNLATQPLYPADKDGMSL